MILLAALGLARTAWAHDVHGEVVLLDIGERVVDAELRAPLSQVALARGERLADLAAHPVIAAPALATEVSLRDAEGAPLTPSVGDIAVERVGDGDVLVAHLRFAAAAGHSARKFELRDELVLGRVTSHNVYVFIRRDLPAGELGDAPRLAGMLHYQHRALAIDRTGATWWDGLCAAIWLGIDHIRDGTDHLLFLVMLVLPAPLVAAGGAWTARRGAGRVRDAAIATAKLATAFTIGHSLTLALGAVLGAQLPARLVEVLVAVSILASAVHALRPVPWIAGREPILAGGFGLIHGLAFSTALAGFGFDGRSLALALVGFNLGVEAMQLAILVAVVPALVVLAAGPGYRAIRIGGAGVGAAAALGWIAERAAGIATPIPGAIEHAAAHGRWIVAGLAAAAAAAALARGWRQAPGAASRAIDIAR